MPSRLRAVIAFGLGAVALAACSPQAAEPTLVPTSAMPPDASTPSRTFSTPSPPRPETMQPPVPPELTDHSEKGSRAAIEYYADLYGYAKNTGDTVTFRSAFTDDCHDCVTAANDVDEAYGMGNTIEGDVPTITHKALLTEYSSENMHVWYVEVDATDITLRAADGKEIYQDEGIKSDGALVAEWIRGRWVVTDFAEVESR